MKKYAKILVLLLSVALAIGATLMVVGAADETVEYTYDLAGAVASAEAGSTVTLTGNAKVESAITVDKNLTIDLAGYKIASSAATAFSVTESVEFTVSGAGAVALDGELYRTASGKSPTVSVVGKSAKEVLGITHTGTASQHITYTYDGTYSYKYVDIYTSFSSSVSGTSEVAFLHNNSATVAAKVTFDHVEFASPKAIPNNPGVFIMSVGGTDSKLTVTDSAFRTGASGVYLGKLRAADAATEVVSVKNSLFSCIGEYQTVKSYVFFFEEFGWKNLGLIGTVNVDSSYVEASGRPFYGSHANSANKAEDVLVNVTTLP